MYVVASFIIRQCLVEPLALGHCVVEQSVPSFFHLTLKIAYSRHCLRFFLTCRFCSFSSCYLCHILLFITNRLTQNAQINCQKVNAKLPSTTIAPKYLFSSVLRIQKSHILCERRTSCLTRNNCLSLKYGKKDAGFLCFIN